MAATTKAVILTNPSDWDAWLFGVKIIARGSQIWDYINPDILIEPNIPRLPMKPTPDNVNQDKSTILELDLSERETYRLLLADYKEELAITNQIYTGLQNVQKHLAATVAASNIVYINDKTTVYQMLVALKKRLAPTDYARKLEITKKYLNTKTFSKTEEVETWLKRWETIYTDGKKLDIPEVSGERPLFDFTHAISAIDSGYSSTQEYFLNQKIKSSDRLPELYDLIEDFRNHYRRTEALKPIASHSAFATLDGQDQSGVKVCLCGKKHLFSDCYYITPSKRPNEWKGKPEIFKSINQKILDNKKYKNWRGWFEKRFKYDGFNDTKDGPNDKKETEKAGSFTINSSLITTLYKYHLYDC